MLDLLRYFIFLQKDAACNKLLHDDRKEELFAILTRCLQQQDQSKTSLLNATCAARCLCNLFATQQGGQFVTERGNETLECFEKNPPTSKNCQVAAATLVMNMAVFMNSNSYMPEAPVRVKCVQVLLTSFLGQQSNEESCLRSLVALGTLLHGNDVCKATAVSLNAEQVLSNVATTFKQSQKVSDCAQHILKSFV